MYAMLQTVLNIRAHGNVIPAREMSTSVQISCDGTKITAVFLIQVHRTSLMVGLCQLSEQICKAGSPNLVSGI